MASTNITLEKDGKTLSFLVYEDFTFCSSEMQSKVAEDFDVYLIDMLENGWKAR